MGPEGLDREKLLLLGEELLGRLGCPECAMGLLAYRAGS